MSKTVDERVLSMQFDNRDFEKNVSTSMSTLDKLKRALKFDGVGKGFENISKAAKNVDMAGLGTAVDTVRAKFSALDVVGVTALANITNSAVNAGKNIVKSLTIDPITSGFKEYELQMNSVQTILANTASKGTTMADVTSALDELNQYADLTIYNFAEMTKNIGTFTAAGVDLDKSVAAIKGIANLGAMSGSTSAQVSTAMYQLSQALAAGRVSLMDWNSVVNAGMGGEQFQNALKRTAEHFGTDVDAMIAKYGSFRESLTSGGWLTAEVLTETLNQISGAYTEADLIQQGYTESQAKAIVEMANTATDAATKVKTFTQLLDTMREAAGSGWAKTWQIILGDFEEAKEFFTSLSDYFGEMIGGSADARNNVLQGAFDSNWVKLTREIEKAGVPLDTFSKKVQEVAKANGVNVDQMIEKYGTFQKVMESGAISGDIIIKTIKELAGAGTELNSSTEAMTDKLEYFQKVVNEVWHGDYKNGQERVEALTKAGYDYAKVQDLVNKTVDGHKLTLEDLNETQMKAVGFTDEEIAALQELAIQAEKTGTPLNDLIMNLGKPSGRVLFLDSITNILKAIIEPLRAVKRGFNEVFAIDSTQVYGALEALNKFSEALVAQPETLDKITRTFKGLFGILNIFTTFATGTFGVAFKALTAVLDHFNLGILDVTAFIGDVLYAFSDFITSGDLIIGVLEKIGSMFSWVIDPIKDFLGNFDGIGQDIINGLKNGLADGVSSIPQMLIDLGHRLIDAICGVLGIHSPSTVFFEIGQNVIEGLLNGLKTAGEKIYSFLKNMAETMINFLGEVDWGRVLSIAALAGIIFVLNKFANGFNKLAAPLEGVGRVLSGTGSILESTADVISASTKKIKKVINSFAKVLNANAFKTRTEGVRNLALSIAILAGSIYILAQLDTGALWNAVGAIAALAAILGVLAFAMDKMSSSAVDITKKGISISALKPSLVGIGVAILALAAVVKILGSMDSDAAEAGFKGLIAVMLSMAAFIGVCALVTKGPGAKNIGKVGTMMLSLSASLLLMSMAAKSIAKMDAADLDRGLAGIMKFVAVFAAMALITRLANSNKTPLKSSILAMTTSIVLLAGVAKILSTMDQSTINKGIKGIYAFVGVFAAMAIVTRLATGQKKRVGTALLGMSVALLAMVGVVKILTMMSPEDIDRGISAITKFVGLMAAMVLITRLGGKDMGSISSTLVSMSIAIGIMAAIAVALSFVKTENLVKGIAAVSALGLVMTAMIWATRGATEVKGPLIAMTVAIGLMATAVAALSFIDPARLATATAAMSAMMLAFGGMIKLTSGAEKIKMGTLAPMLAVVGALALIVSAMSLLDTRSALPNVLALSTLLMAFSTSIMIIGKTGGIGKNATAGLAMMVLVTGMLATILGVMSHLNVEASISSAIALSTLLLALSGALRILDGVKRVSGNALGSMAILALVVGELGVVLGLMDHFNIDVSISTAISLGILINALALACGIISMVPLAGAVSGALGLAAFIGIMAAVVTAAGALAQIPGLTWLVEEGGDLLQKVGEALGKLVGGLIGGVGAGITASLPEMATNLTAFMQNLQGFIEGAKSIDSSVVDSVGALATAILIITAANFVDGITRFLGMGNGLAGFGEQAKSLGEGLSGFAQSVSNLDESSVEKINIAASAIKALAEAADSIPNSGGLLGKIVGENDMGAFAEQFGSVAKSIMSFVDSIGDIDESAVTKVESAAAIIVALAKAAQEIPNSGGWLGEIVGENDIDTFGSKLPAMGRSLTEFAASVSGIDESAVSKVSVAANMIKELAGVAKEIPNTGGLLAALVGDNDMTTFATDMTNMGNGLTSFSNSISDLPEDIGIKVATAIDVIRQLAEFVNSGVLQGEDSIFEKLGHVFGGGGGETSVFGEQMSNLGKGMSNFANEVGDIDILTVSTAVGAIQTIATTLSGITSINGEVVDSIASSLPKLGSALKSYSDSASEINVLGVSMTMGTLTTIVSTMASMSGLNSESVDAAITAIRKLTSAINGMAGMDTSGVTSFVSSLQQLASANVAGVIEAFRSGETELSNVGSELITSIANGMSSNSSATIDAAETILTSMQTTFSNAESEFNTIGSDLVGQVENGIESGNSAVQSAITSLVSSASSTLRSYYDSFYSSGAYVAQGFANGISANSYLAQAKASAMASAAASAARKALNEHSPSKVFYEIGDFAGLGFVNALDAYGTKSYQSGAAMADYARKGLSRAIRSVGNLLENGIDTQPTIRPVLDLSDVRSGTGTLRDMLSDSDLRIGAAANIRAINTMMRQNSQNGANDDVVSAINRLRKGLNETGGNTYNINGITYDDGSNVADAIKALVRAARVERRM